MNKIVFATCVIMIVGTSCKLQTPPASGLNLVNGKADTEGKFPSVVQVAIDIGSNGKGTVRAMCTASIISDRVILTAAHCVTKKGMNPDNAVDNILWANNGQPGMNPYALTGQTYTQTVKTNNHGGVVLAKTASAIIEINGQKKEIKNGRPLMHTSYNDSTVANDVAVVVFAEGTFKDFKHMKVATPEEVKVNSGDKIMIVGYGKNNQFDERSGGTKRYGGNTITRVGKTIDFTGVTTPKEGAARNDGTNVFNSQGDSGGPMMNDKGIIIGVSSTQDSVSEGDTTGVGHYTNLVHPEIASWLAKYINKNGESIDLPDVAPSDPIDFQQRDNDYLAQNGSSTPQGAWSSDALASNRPESAAPLSPAELGQSVLQSPVVLGADGKRYQNVNGQCVCIN